MVKVGGTKYTKVRKKQVNFLKTGGKFLKVGGIIIFVKQRGNVLKEAKRG